MNLRSLHPHALFHVGTFIRRVMSASASQFLLQTLQLRDLKLFCFYGFFLLLVFFLIAVQSCTFSALAVGFVYFSIFSLFFLVLFTLLFVFHSAVFFFLYLFIPSYNFVIL